MKETIFKGFTPATIKFFKDLEENNNKDWFEANRSIYEKELLEPLKAFASSLSPTMHSIDAQFELRPHRVISRIYRDTRFSKNKDPYKQCMWMTFQIPAAISGEWQSYPGYFFELTAKRYSYGMGLFMPKRKIMDDFRDNIIFRAEEFQQNTQKFVLNKDFVIIGEEYKKPLKNTLPDYYQQWIQRKSIAAIKEIPIGEEFFSAQLVENIKEDFRNLEWFYNFLKESQP